MEAAGSGMATRPIEFFITYARQIKHKTDVERAKGPVTKILNTV